MKTVLVITFCFFFTQQLAYAGRNYDTHNIKTKVENYEYESLVYRPKTTRIKAILIISPTISNVDSIEGANAQYFAKRGYLVIVTYPFITELNKENPDMDKLDSDYYRPIHAAISFINQVEFQFKLPSNLPIFALGASQGGISSILLAAHISRIKALWVAVAGGDLPHIYARSDVEQIKQFRDRHMRTLGMTNLDTYEAYLRLYLNNDPSISCKAIKVPYHQTIALKDTSVPTVTQELLAKECPAHRMVRLNQGHRAGTLSIVIQRKDIYDFFEKAI